METTQMERLDDQLATLAAHINGATARFVELVQALLEEGGLVDEAARYVAFRCGITTREAREVVRVAEALCELPAIREAFSRGELTFTKVRSLTRVATPESDEGLLELASALTAAQLERAVRAFRRVQAEEAGEAHALEYVDYHWAEDGSLYLRARLAAEDGTLVVRALEAARERVWARRRDEDASDEFEPARSAGVEALVEVAHTALGATAGSSPERARLIVHVDALALTADSVGRSELEDGPVIAPETARRLGCDAETVATIERDGLPLGVGCSRRATIAPAAGRVARTAVTSTRITAPTGRTEARPASTTSSSSARITIAWYTRAATRSRTTRRAGFASATATAYSVPPSRGRRRGARMSLSLETGGTGSTSARVRTESATAIRSTSSSRFSRSRACSTRRSLGAETLPRDSRLFDTDQGPDGSGGDGFDTSTESNLQPHRCSPRARPKRETGLRLLGHVPSSGVRG